MNEAIFKLSQQVNKLTSEKLSYEQTSLANEKKAQETESLLYGQVLELNSQIEDL